MFVKCANASCPRPFHFALGTMVFRVETRLGIGADSQNGAPKKSEPTVEYHWLCPECLHIVLISWFDHRGVARTPAGESGRTRKTVGLISLDDLRWQWRGHCEEKESPTGTKAKAS